ncbi:MAG: transposase [Candidatus Oleimicrobiaceae bacterium]
MAITDLIGIIPHTMDIIPSVGPVFSARILSAIGDLSRFHGDVHAQITKVASFKYRKHHSGDSKARDAHLSQAHKRYFSYSFCDGAKTLRMPGADYTAYYKRKDNDVRKHQYKRTIVLTARKLV